jgi:uncharacterized membrane protein YheB (UPF0754 family)
MELNLNSSKLVNQINSYVPTIEKETQNRSRWDAQKVIELSELSSNQFCPDIQSNTYKISKLNVTELSRLILDQISNPAFFQELSCIVQGVINGDPQYVYIHQWFSNLRLIGEGTGKYADVFSVDYKETIGNGDEYTELVDLQSGIIRSPRAENLFAIKVSPEKNVIHDVFIGRYLNLIREYTPSFAYIFGYFECSSPFLSQGRPTVWCTSKGNPTVYGVYENIFPSLQMYDWCASCKDSDFITTYYGILEALDIAYEAYDFTHYDLHTDNVLMQKIGSLSEFDLPIRQENKDEGELYIRLFMLPRIIDYGTSHIRESGNSYGYYLNRKYITAPDKSLPMFDALKLLLNCMVSMINFGNKAAYDVASKVLKFFTNEEPSSFIQAMSSINYSLPYDDSYSSIRVSEVQKYIRKNLPAFLKIKSEKQKKESLDTTIVLSCFGESCLSTEQIQTRIGYGRKDPMTIMELSLMYDDVDPMETRVILSKFPLESAIKEHIQILNSLADRIYKLSVSLQPSSLLEKPLSDLFSNEFFDSYSAFVTSLTKAYSLVREYQDYYAALDKVCYLYNNSATINAVAEQEKTVRDYFNYIVELCNSVLEDVKLLHSYKSNKEMFNKLREYSNDAKYNWYYRNLIMIDRILP